MYRHPEQGLSPGFEVASQMVLTIINTRVKINPKNRTSIIRILFQEPSSTPKNPTSTVGRMENAVHIPYVRPPKCVQLSITGAINPSIFSNWSRA